MKILIWIFSCFIIVGIPNALLWQLNLQFGAIPTVILTGAAYATARALCKKWDEHKADKKDAKTANTEKIDNTDSTATSESDYTVVAEISDIPEVEAEFVGTDDTKHSFKKLHIGKGTTAALIIISLLLASSVAGNIYQAYTNQTMQAEITSLEEIKEDHESTIENLNAKVSVLNRHNDNLQKTISFYDEYVVIVVDDNTNTYHTYGCLLCDTDNLSFWAYNINAARLKGYTHCSYCRY